MELMQEARACGLCLILMSEEADWCEECAPAAEAARQGAELLDTHKPGWLADIEIQRLDVSSPTDCVLGQVYAEMAATLQPDAPSNGYDAGMNDLFGRAGLGHMSRSREHGFSGADHGVLNMAWSALIEERLGIIGARVQRFEVPLLRDGAVATVRVAAEDQHAAREKVRRYYESGRIDPIRLSWVPAIAAL